jgi:hypothetical protein
MVSSGPLFPATRVTQNNDYQFQASGLSRARSSNATPIRAIFNEAFTQAGLPYATRIPSARWRNLASVCATRPKSSKPGARTSGTNSADNFSSYGQIASDRQAELMGRLGQHRMTNSPRVEIIEQPLNFLHDSRSPR